MVYNHTKNTKIAYPTTAMVEIMAIMPGTVQNIASKNFTLPPYSIWR